MSWGANGESETYVLEVTFFGEYGWTSLHNTLEGARARLEQKVDEHEVRTAYEAEARCKVGSDTSIASEQDGDMVMWRINRLPVDTS